MLESEKERVKVDKNDFIGRNGTKWRRFIPSRPTKDEYFLTVLVYIHQNPVKAGICSLPEDYEWGSRRFLGKSGSAADNAALTAMFCVDAIKERESELIEDKEIEPMHGRRPSYADKEVAAIMRQLCGARNASDFQKMPSEKQRPVVEKMREDRVPIRQIARVTGRGQKGTVLFVLLFVFVLTCVPTYRIIIPIAR